MATGTQSSTLGAVAQKAAAAAQIRQRLSMDAPNGSPQAGQAQPAAPTTPNSSAGPAMDVDSMVDQAFQQRGGDMEETVRRAMPTMTQQQDGGQMLAGGGGPMPEAPSAPVQSPFDYLNSEVAPLQQRIERLGAVSVSPQEQFARLAGRNPSPRELALFNARTVLEGQLGRPPTSNELKIYVMRPEETDNSFQPAMEMPQ